jgi:hypothetical protein
VNTFKYKYSILKYKHSAILGESINIGVLFYFPTNDKFIFRYSKNLKRIKSIYDLNSEKIIKHYLTQIDRFLSNSSSRIKDDEIEFEKFDFDTFIRKHIIPKDDSSIQFSQSRNSKTRNHNFENTANKIATNYLLENFIEKSKIENRESIISNNFYNNITNSFSKAKLESLTSQKKLIKNYNVVNENGHEYHFDYAWQNGSLNLVKPFNLDLKRSYDLMNKAYKSFGLFTDLEVEAERDNLRYDLIVSKPTRQDLFNDFDHSIKLLNKIKNVEIVLEDEIENYSKRAVNALLK